MSSNFDTVSTNYAQKQKRMQEEDALFSPKPLVGTLEPHLPLKEQTLNAAFSSIGGYGTVQPQVEQVFHYDSHSVATVAPRMSVEPSFKEAA